MIIDVGELQLNFITEFTDESIFPATKVFDFEILHKQGLMAETEINQNFTVVVLCRHKTDLDLL